MSVRRIELSIALILVVLTGGMFYLNYDVPFLYDDLRQILGNPSIRNPFDLTTILNDPLRPSRLVQNFTFALNWVMSPGQSWSFHLFNDLLHLCNALLLFRLLGSLGVKDVAVKGAAALLFLLHPLQVESVTYVMGRVELLKTFVTLAALVYYLSPKKNIWILYAWLSASLLVKETCVLTPILFIALDLTVRDLSIRQLNYKEHALYFSHAVWFVAIKSVLSFRAHTGAVGFDLYPFADYLVSNLHYLTYYVYLFFNPAEQSIYHEWIQDPPLATVAIGALLYGAMAFLCLACYRRRPIEVFLLVFFLLSFGPNSTVLQFINPFAEYRLYQSNLSLAVLLAIGLVSGERYRGPRMLLASFLVLFFGASHVFYLTQWHDPVSIWTYATAKYPNSTVANVNLGTQFYARGMCKNAMRAFEAGCKSQRFEIYRERCMTYQIRTLLMAEDWERVLPLLQSVIQESGTRPAELYVDYLEALKKLGKEQDFQRVLQEARARYPKEFLTDEVPRRMRRTCVANEPLAV